MSVPALPSSRPRQLRSASWPLLLAPLLSLGCASAPKPRDEFPPAPDLRMGTLEIEAKATLQGGYEFEYRDADSLFEAASALQRRGKYDEAMRLYRLQLERFSTPELDLAARYNLAMALEDTGQCEEAMLHYDAVLATATDDDDTRDALFRKSGCLQRLGRHAEALPPLRQVLDMPTTQHLTRYEALVRSGEVRTALEQLDEAEDTFRLVITRARPRPGRSRSVDGEPPVLQPGPLLARSHLGQARVLRRRFQLLPLRLPLEVMETDVAAKIGAFKRAQSSFLRAVRQGVPGITTAAGLELGAMYEGICEDLIKAPHPPEFHAEEVAVYHEELLKEVLPLLDEAVYVYEKNLGVAARLGASNRFVDATQRRLAELRGLLADTRPDKPGAMDAIRQFLALKPTNGLVSPR